MDSNLKIKTINQPVSQKFNEVIKQLLTDREWVRRLFRVHLCVILEEQRDGLNSFHEVENAVMFIG